MTRQETAAFPSIPDQDLINGPLDAVKEKTEESAALMSPERNAESSASELQISLLVQA